MAQPRWTRTVVRPRPVVLIYDRNVFLENGALLERLRECRRHVLARGWIPVGTWIDAGDVALSAEVRPQLDVALSCVSRLRRDEYGHERDVVVLVHSMDRLSNDAFAASGLVWTIGQAGARFETVFTDADGHRCPSTATARAAGDEL